MTRTTRLLSLAAAAALAVAACAGSVSTTTRSNAPEASDAPASAASPASQAPSSEAPAASVAAEGPDINAAAAALANIQSYALDIKASGLADMAAGANEITMSGLVDRESDAYQYTVSGFAGLEELGGASAISFIVIGDDAWISTGDDNYIPTPGGAAMFSTMQQGLEPAKLLASIPAGSLQHFPVVGQEEKNGVATTHYHVTGADSPEVAEGLGADAVIDLWLADEGGFIVSMAMNGTTDVNGTATPVTMSMDISRINDDMIAIEAPN
jgi:hypothetical protein